MKVDFNDANLVGYGFWGCHKIAKGVIIMLGIAWCVSCAYDPECVDLLILNVNINKKILELVAKGLSLNAMIDKLADYVCHNKKALVQIIIKTEKEA